MTKRFTISKPYEGPPFELLGEVGWHEGGYILLQEYDDEHTARVRVGVLNHGLARQHMTKQKSRRPQRARHAPLGEPSDIRANPCFPIATPDATGFIPGPKLRAKLDISAVTLWRWRHDLASDFPAPKVIKGRLYFPLGAVEAWLAQQPDAA
jgi:predicted DNA-binding transcriptional regulator AlpA